MYRKRHYRDEKYEFVLASADVYKDDMDDDYDFAKSLKEKLTIFERLFDEIPEDIIDLMNSGKVKEAETELDDYYYNWSWDNANNLEEENYRELLTHLLDKPCKMTGNYNRWDGSHELADNNYYRDYEKAIRALIFSHYDKTYQLYATPDYKHFKYLESNHDASGTTLYIEPLSSKEQEEYDNGDLYIDSIRPRRIRHRK